MITFAMRRPEKVWAIQFTKFQTVDDGKTVYKANTDEIEKFLAKFGYPQNIYTNCNGCVAINCHGKMSVLTDGDVVVRNEHNTISVMGISDFTKMYESVVNPCEEYAIEVVWPDDITPTTYIGGRYESIEIVTAILKSKKDELGVTDEFIGKTERILSEQLPQMGVINSNECARFDNMPKCIVKCWRSK